MVEERGDRIEDRGKPWNQKEGATCERITEKNNKGINGQRRESNKATESKRARWMREGGKDNESQKDKGRRGEEISPKGLGSY